MKRALVLAAFAVGVLGATPVAHAAAWKGVVIAKDAKRHTLVTTSRNGVVRTVRSPKGFAKEALGDVVAVKGARLPDGTFAAAATRRLAKRDRVRLQGVVVRKQGSRLVLSAGHSVVAVRLPKGFAGAGSTLGAGDRVALGASVGNAGLLCDGGIKEVGHEGQLEVQGIYLSTDGAVLSLAVVHRGLVKVTVPDGIDLPELASGDELSLLVKVEPDGSFTLVSIQDENDGGDDGGSDGGVDISKNQFTVSGVIASISADAVSVTVDRHPDPVRCATSNPNQLAGFSVGQLVEMQCYFTGGRFVLYALHSKTADIPGDGGDGELDLSGFVSSIDAAKVVVEVVGGNPVTCLLRPGQDLRGFAAGDFVELGCRYSAPAGNYLLTSLSSPGAWLSNEPDEDGNYASFDLQGVVAALAPTYVSVRVAHHAEPVACALPTGMDLRGFAVGDTVELQCDNAGSGFVASSISSDSASWGPDDMPQFTLDGILRSIGTDSIGVQVERHQQLVRCAMPPGADLSGFAVGDTVELHCHFHNDKWNLATLDSSTANLTLEGD